MKRRTSNLLSAVFAAGAIAAFVWWITNFFPYGV